MAVPDLLDPELIADPYTGFGRLREEAAVVKGRNVDGSPMWYVTRQADVRTVLSDPRFANDPASVPGGVGTDARAAALAQLGVPEDLTGYLTDSILSADGADHTRLRKLVSRAFTVGRVSQLRPRVEAITAGLLDGLTDPAELIEQFAYPLPIRVICELVGVPEADRPAWRRWATALGSMDPTVVPTAVREMVDHVHALIARRRARPEGDLLTALVQAHEEGDRLSDTELVTMVFALVIAGHETTAHLIGNGTFALLTHPDQLALLRRDPGLWPGAVHELMRWCGPVTATGIRYATEDLELGGVLISRGDAVEAVIVSANRDPRTYRDPDRFDVTRRPAGRGDGHVGFGYGIHYCLGAALARQEGEVALRALFARFPGLALVDPEPDWMPRPGMRRLATLRVHLG
jgi:cytochrome P450